MRPAVIRASGGRCFRKAGRKRGCRFRLRKNSARRIATNATREVSRIKLAAPIIEGPGGSADRIFC